MAFLYILQSQASGRYFVGSTDDVDRRLLAEHLDISAAAVTILSGERSRTKRVAVQGVTPQRIRELV